MFVDEIYIEVSAGNGGNGCISFRREKFVPRGGPDGGDGGDGGAVLLVGDARRKTLAGLSGNRKIKAQRGGDGSSRKKTGAKGDDETITVPIGTVAYDSEDGTKLGEVIEDKQVVVLAKGGLGGKGNINFATSTDQAPRYATSGTPAQKYSLKLELKILGDVALVGFPNAGKSSLLTAMTGAHPRIAPYPFTTLAPQLGVVRLGFASEYTLMEVPGLVEDASDGKGLGYTFLRHIERAKRLVLVVDTASTEPTPDQALEILTGELAKYKAGLIEKICAIAANKIDITNEDDVAAFSKDKHWQVFPVSAATYAGLEELKPALYKHLLECDDEA